MYWQPDERKVADYIRASSGTVFVDIGSNRGFHSKLAKKRYKRVVSIEPDPRWHYNKPLRYFITSHRGPVTAYHNEANDFLTLNEDFHVHGTEIRTRRPQTAQAVTYDDLNLDADLVKIDVDGAELDVLDGMRKYLPKTMIVELHDERRAEELCNKLIEKGYDVSMLTGYHYLAEHK